MQAILNHYIAMWKNILQFEGKTSRPGYWWPMLVNIFVGVLVGLLVPALADIYTLALNVATFTLTCRRIRDAGFNWMFALLNFAGIIPLIGGLLTLVPFVMCLLPSKEPNVVDVI